MQYLRQDINAPPAPVSTVDGRADTGYDGGAVAVSGSPPRIRVRKVQFAYPDDLDPHWNPARPE